MAEALFNRAAGHRAIGRSGGTQPAGALHPAVVVALDEIGIVTADLQPKPLTPELTEGVDVVVTMGCGDECPVIPGASVVDWDLPDPAGTSLDIVRAILADIRERVEGLFTRLSSAHGTNGT